MSRRSFIRFLRWLGCLMGGYFLLTAILSLTVDPWRINHTRWAVAALDPAREISNTVRVGKAALANRGDWQVVMLGSSRIEIGLDPTHPVFGTRRTCNLAMSAAHLLETIPAGNYLLDRNPQIETLILGIEAGDLHNDWDSRKYARFYQSPFADDNHSIERSINQIIGGRSLVDSIATLQRYFDGTKPIRSQLGQWLQPNHPANLRQYVESAFEMGFEICEDQWNLRPQILRQQKADLLEKFIILVRQAGIEMHIVVPPQHALKQLHPSLDQPETMCWENDLRALADICIKANAVVATGPPVKLWSFMTFNDYTTIPMPEPGAKSQQMPGWFDLGHAQSKLGDRVLSTIFAGRPGADVTSAPVGVSLLEGDWNVHRANWIAAHREYCLGNPRDVAWWRGLFSRFPNKLKAARQMAEAPP
ncbi:MAG: hypothetical protein K9N23_03740 [Akkermansiaceae bacterium]|nr:hypothetical protein [Akkermansiaceae bacterium]MCF7730769.1 hypothetical protein [Akkermansiaceae bacterium]